MKKYQLYASTYESVEQMKAHHISDIALEIKRSSSPFYTSAKTPQEAARLFQETKQFDAFLSQHTGKTVSTYYINNVGDPVKIEP